MHLSNPVPVLALLLALSGLLFAGPARADCADPGFHWTGGQPDINLRHVFCGEVGQDGRPKGVHSRVLIASAPDVERVEPGFDAKAGIYRARVLFRNGRDKTSTFFPDHCSVEQIVRSVEHAVRHSTVPHPDWGVLGPSAPAEGGGTYCLDADGRVFTIRSGLLRDGRVNTAFPVR